MTTRATVRIAVNEGITAAAVHRAVDEVLKAGGCTGCGLVGIDVLVRASDPEFNDRFATIAKLDVSQIEGVNNVAVFSASDPMPM